MKLNNRFMVAGLFLVCIMMVAGCARSLSDGVSIGVTDGLSDGISSFVADLVGSISGNGG